MKTTVDTTKDIIRICLESAYSQRKGEVNYFYTYLHLNPITEEPYYIGQGSANRAYKYRGRSKKWYEKYHEYGVKIEIYKYSISFQESIDLEKVLVLKYKSTLVNEEYGHNPKEAFPVLCFSKEGRLIKRYQSSQETVVDGFFPDSIRKACQTKKGRLTYQDFVWCYEKDYESIKDIIFKPGKTSKRRVKISFPDGTIKVYDSISSTIEDGFSPKVVSAACLGKQKSYKKCKCEFV
jgi:hypothetical protein